MAGLAPWLSLPEDETPEGGQRKQLREWALQSYTNMGSLYMASLGFLPLGLPASHSSWASEAEPWTSQKIWSGADVGVDRNFM